MTLYKTGASKEALFCIGSNCGDRQANVARALRWLSEILTDMRQSSIYATPDCTGGQREYLNAVCSGKCDMTTGKLRQLCKAFELSLGRDLEARAVGNVPVDVDLVVFDGEILRERDFGSEFFQIGLAMLAER